MHFNREIIFDRIWGRLRRILWRYGGRLHDLAIILFSVTSTHISCSRCYMHNILNKPLNILNLGSCDNRVANSHTSGVTLTLSASISHAHAHA